LASPKSSPKERTLASLFQRYLQESNFFRTLSFGEGRVRHKKAPGIATRGLKDFKFI